MNYERGDLAEVQRMIMLLEGDPRQNQQRFLRIADNLRGLPYYVRKDRIHDIEEGLLTDLEERRSAL